MSDDPWGDPKVRRWKHHVEREVIPMIESSDSVVSLAPPDGKADVKFAVELGLAIMLDKPIIVVASPSRPVPPKLALIATHVIDADITTPEGREQLMFALQELGAI